MSNSHHSDLISPVTITCRSPPDILGDRYVDQDYLASHGYSWHASNLPVSDVVTARDLADWFRNHTAGRYSWGIQSLDGTYPEDDHWWWSRPQPFAFIPVWFSDLDDWTVFSLTWH